MPNDSLIDAFPLDAETPESILGRLLADINAGVDPTDPLYADVVPGSVWDDLTRADMLEFDRLYDRAFAEVPAAALPVTATGAWLDAWAATVKLARKVATPAGGSVRFTGDPDAVIANSTSVAAPGAVPGADPIVFQTTEPAAIPHSGVDYVDVPVIAVLDGGVGNVPANSVTLLESEVAGVTVSNPNPLTGGSDIETDEALQVRVDGALNAAPGAGNIDYYTNLGLNYPGVGFVTVKPNTPTAGFAEMVITDVNNNPAPSSIVDGLQAQVDPGSAPGDGFGDATIGATVTVSTPVFEDVTVAATIEYEPGYSADGAGGTIALGPAISMAVENYVNRLPVGATVVLHKVLAAIIDVIGVHDVTALTLNTVAADLVLGTNNVATVIAVNLT